MPIEITKTWGIDLEGRKMWYDPWPVDIDGIYKQPSPANRIRLEG